MHRWVGAAWQQAAGSAGGKVWGQERSNVFSMCNTAVVASSTRNRASQPAGTMHTQQSRQLQRQ